MAPSCAGFLGGLPSRFISSSGIYGMPTACWVLENRGQVGDLSIALFILEFSRLNMSFIFPLPSHGVLYKHFIQITKLSSIFSKVQKKIKRCLAP